MIRSSDTDHNLRDFLWIAWLPQFAAICRGVSSTGVSWTGTIEGTLPTACPSLCAYLLVRVRSL
jgi:hypothetical protein